MVRLRRISSLSDALLNLAGAVVAYLRVALLQVPSVSVIVSIELVVVGM
jgi:hypothetical protein